MKNLILIFLLFLSNGLFAQLTMRVKNMEIGNIIIPENERINENGPYLVLKCIIENNTDTVVALCLDGDKSLADFNCVYSYEGKRYVGYNGGMICCFSNVIIGNDRLWHVPSLIKLHPHASVELSGGTDIFVPDSLLPVREETGSLDYTDYLLQILPTLHIEYHDENLTIRATEIERVTLNRDTLYP